MLSSGFTQWCGAKQLSALRTLNLHLFMVSADFSTEPTPRTGVEGFTDIVQSWETTGPTPPDHYRSSATVSAGTSPCYAVSPQSGRFETAAKRDCSDQT
jgi:hypothetical protein